MAGPADANGEDAYINERHTFNECVSSIVLLLNELNELTRLREVTLMVLEDTTSTLSRNAFMKRCQESTPLFLVLCWTRFPSTVTSLAPEAPALTLAQGPWDVKGKVPDDLDECGGHTDKEHPFCMYCSMLSLG